MSCGTLSGMTRRWATAVALLTVLTCACSSGPQRTAVTGHLLRVGGPAPGAPLPLPGTVTATRSDGDATTVRTGSDGAYQLRLAPGIYSLSGASPEVDNGTAGCASPAAITVGRSPQEAD